MTEPTAGDPFAAPPGGRPAEPAQPYPTSAPGYAAAPAPQNYPPAPQGYSAPAPGYAAPDGYYPYGYPPQKKPKSWMNIVSISAVAAGLFFPFFANIAGIVFGHLGLRAAKRGEADYRGWGLAGLILNYIAVVLCVLGIVAYIVFIVWAVSDCSNNPGSSFCSSSTTFTD